MRVLLDECVDVRFAREIIGHETRTVAQMGWAGAKDGDLLRLAAAAFDVLVTTDQNLEFQQNLQRFDIAIVVLKARTNRLADLRPLVPALLEVLPTVVSRTVTHIDA